MKRKLLRLFKIPLIITALYLILLSYYTFTQFGFFSVVERIPIDFEKTNQQDIHLLQDQKATATFKASGNNLGIIFVRLVKFGQGNDNVVFRIKKEGEETWYHESTFGGEQIKDYEYFPLGFPPIADSKNNTYVFELESLSGGYNKGIGIVKDEPGALMYKYSMGDLRDYRNLSSFIYKKFLYVLENINYWQIAALFVISSLFSFFIKKEGFAASKNEARAKYLFIEKKIVYFSKKATRWFTSVKFYLWFLNTDTRKRIVIGLLIFFLALIYRFSSTLIGQDKLFYAGLGGQGDYDQFIRVSTCALNFCSGILGQNFLLESAILGAFFSIFGFVGALKAYVYLMIILSSIVATIPHFLLSRKSWISVGGILGSLFLATSDFLTHMSLNFPPDNGSLFTFSLFFIVYFMTIQKANIRWLLFFGFIGAIDALNKALFILNDLVALGLFVPVFFYEKVKERGLPKGGQIKSIFRKANLKLLLLSVLPLLVFLVIYIGWEYFVQIKFSAVYFLRGLIQTGGKNYEYYTSVNDSSFLTGNILFKLVYLSVSAIVMIKRLIDYTNLQIIFLAPILLGLVFATFIKRKAPIKKLMLTILFSVLTITFLILIKDNFFRIHNVFSGEYISYNWKIQTYIGIYLFLAIIFLFLLNFKYSVLKLALPILPYVFMLVILTKNSPFARLHTHVVAWSIILFAYLINWILLNINKYSKRIEIILLSSLLILFVLVYLFPKMVYMVTQLRSGIAYGKNEVEYLKWVNSSLPNNAVIFAGGKSDLITVSENIKKPIIYNSLYSAAVLIKPKEIPGIAPTDFAIISELGNKDNFKRNKYIILEDDVYLWRDRVAGVADNVFVSFPKTLSPEDYSLKVYKFNHTLKKGIYELTSKSGKE